MKRVGLSLVIMFVGVWSLTSCDSNAALENRVNELESRVSELEGGDSQAALGTTQTAAFEENATASSGAVASGNASKFEFEETTHDFGTITEGEVVEHTFKFTNTGEAPLVIQNTSASCGCTTPSYSREPVAPGETGEVQVKFNSQSRPGVQNKTITITANTEPSVTRLFIKTNVTPKGEEVSGPIRK
ncbi:MAG: DUF1573 domain-containing protein [Cyclobacteriaceae bacterium]